MPIKALAAKKDAPQEFTFERQELGSCCAVGAYGYFATKNGPEYDYKANIGDLTKQIIKSSKQNYDYSRKGDTDGRQYQYIIHVLFEQDELLRAKFVKAGWKELTTFPGNHGRRLVMLGIESTAKDVNGEPDDGFYDDESDVEISIKDYDEKKHYHHFNG